MPMIRLIYFSCAADELTMADIQQILTAARRNNPSQSIGGMLCFERRYFLQVLEGERAAVNALYLDIADDSRHQDIQILSYEEVQQPAFQQWSMGFAPSNDDFYRLLSELGQNQFNPQAMTADQALNFTLHLAQQTQIQPH